MFTNSDKDKYKGAGHPVDGPLCTDRSEAKTTRDPADLCSVPTGSQRPVDVGSEPTVVERRAAAETQKYIKQYITK